MDLKGLEEYRFEPDFRDNLKSPPEARIWAELQPITARARLKCVRTVLDRNGAAVVEPDFEAFVIYGLKRLHNVSVDGKAIETAEQLLSCTAEAADLLIRQIGMELFISSRRFDSKNL